MHRGLLIKTIRDDDAQPITLFDADFGARNAAAVAPDRFPDTGPVKAGRGPARPEAGIPMPGQGRRVAGSDAMLRRRQCSHSTQEKRGALAPADVVWA
jgi:hypothetical protein